MTLSRLSSLFSGYLSGARTGSRAWYATEATGVSPVREHGAFRYLLFTVRTAASLSAMMKLSPLSPNSSARKAATHGG